MKPGDTGIVRVIRAFGYSIRGITATLRHEAAFRQEMALFLIMTPLGVWLGQTGVEKALLIGSLFIVLITELLNSAVESVVDRVGAERHELSGRAKDMGSAAVLLSLVNVLVVWGLVLLPRWL
jgi:diacylglycerol kinase (ATP)